MKLSGSQLLELEAVVKVGYDGSVSDRAAMVLAWADDESVARIAERFGVSRPTVYKWAARFEVDGLEGLVNRVSTGRPRTVPGSERARILAATKTPPPEDTGLSHWSSYSLADYLRRTEGIDVSHNFISTLWRDNGIQPHRQGTFKMSKDPHFAAKVVDIVGLYLDPPAGAVVLSVDEKTQVQALDRTQPLLPVSFGKTEKRTHDYVRHGTTNLFAALDVLTGRVTGTCKPRRRTQEFLEFMDEVVTTYPTKQDMHVILDNLSTHSGEDVGTWLQRHPNVRFHHTPVGSSWINQIENWFGILTRQAITRGTFVSVAHLVRRIDTYITHWNEDSKPFTWIATAAQILEKVAILERDYGKLLANNG